MLPLSPSPKAVFAVSLFLSGCGGGAGKGGTKIEAPRITSGPQAVSVGLGGSATFRVKATGGQLAYRWTKDGFEIPGADAASYTISPVTLDSAGTYAVRIANPEAVITSEGALLTVAAVPTLETSPSALVVAVGGRAAFSVVARGGLPLAYQWTKDGTAIPGAAAADYGIPAVVEGDSGTYAVTVTNAFGSVTSKGAALSVGTPPTLDRGPFLTRGRVVTIPSRTFVAVSVSGSQPLRYAWTKDGVSLGSDASVFYRGAGTYAVTVSNAWGAASASASLSQ